MTNEIAIVGAGIGGLTLAKTLELRGIAFHLFEKSESFEELGYGINEYQEIEKAFLRYEELRKDRTTKAQKRSQKNGDIYHATGIKRIFRDLLFKYVDSVQSNLLGKQLS